MHRSATIYKMGKVFILCILIPINILGCEKLGLKIDVPNCIENKIKEFKDSPLACDSRAKVLRYYFLDSQVYVFEPGDCGADLPTDVYDSNCNIICTLGGYAGNTICQGVNFEENATNKILVWGK